MFVRKISTKIVRPVLDAVSVKHFATAGSFIRIKIVWKKLKNDWHPGALVLIW